MRLTIATLTVLAATLCPIAVNADLAPIADAAVMVRMDPDSVDAGSAVNASYLSTGGYAVTSREYLDYAAVVFDLGATTSVSRAVLTMPIDAKYPLGGSVPVEVYAFADNGRIEHADYSLGFDAAIARIELAGVSQLVLDVTGFTNAMLRSGRYVGFKVKSAVAIGDVPEEGIPAYKGVKFNSAYKLDFTPGTAPRPGGTSTRFDGYTFITPEISVPGFGTVNVELQLRNVNDGLFTMVAAEILSGGTGSAPARKGLELLDCAAFTAPTGATVLPGKGANYSISSGLLVIPELTFNGGKYSAELSFVEGTEPMQFVMNALAPVTSGTTGTSVSILTGTTVEPTQDFIPLCHGWVLIGDTTRNRLVERNVISGETAATYSFNTKPNQLMLDEPNGRVYLSVHPESERLYKLTYSTGKITYNRIIEGARQYSVRDMALGESGNVFAVLYDADQLEPEDEDEPVAESGLWLGLLDTNGGIVRPSIPLADPIRIEYDPVFRRIFLTTESNLATLTYDPGSHAIEFVEGTDISIGSACTDFSISPDGTRLAYPCPAGNVEVDVAEPHVGIHDLDPVDYKNPDGEWYLGQPPVSSVFNSSGTLLIATDGTKLYIFDVVTHLLLEDYDLGLDSSEKVEKLRLSKDGKFILLLMENALSATSGKIYWMPMPAISGTPL